MAWTKQGARLAMFGYLLVAAAVLAGLGWATIASLRLERTEQLTQRQESQHQALRQAINRLDARVQFMLTRETGRQAYEYETVDYPVNLWHSSGRKVKAGE
ncbi:MAG: hypothetical protein ACE5GE_04175, partial [Phycisphaerae bacterium]